MKDNTRSENSPTPRRKLPSKINFALMWLFFILGIGVLANMYMSEISLLGDLPTKTDFYKFYLSSDRALQDESPYQPAHLLGNSGQLCDDVPRSAMDASVQSHMTTSGSQEIPPSCLHPNLNPPVFIALTKPLARLDFSTAWWLWSITSIFCGALSLILIFRARVWPAVHGPAAAALLGVLFFGYFPTFSTISLGQTTLFLFLPLTLGWLALRRGDNQKAGIWLGLAASMKPFVGLIFPLLLLRRDWHAASTFTVSFLIAILFGGWIVGFDSYSAYVAVLDTITWYATSWNASFTGFFTRIFGGSLNVPWVYVPPLAKILTVACSLVVFYIVARITMQLEDHDRAVQADALLALAIPAMLLISPFGWVYYFPLLSISILISWIFSESFPNRRSYRIILAFAVAMTAIPSVIIQSQDMNNPLYWLQNAAPYFFALLMIFVISAITIRQKFIVITVPKNS